MNTHHSNTKDIDKLCTQVATKVMTYYSIGQAHYLSTFREAVRLRYELEKTDKLIESSVVKNTIKSVSSFCNFLIERIIEMDLLKTDPLEQLTGDLLAYSRTILPESSQYDYLLGCITELHQKISDIKEG